MKVIIVKQSVINNTKVLLTTMQPKIYRTYVTTYETINENKEIYIHNTIKNFMFT